MRRLTRCAAMLLVLLGLAPLGARAAAPSGTVTGAVRGNGTIAGLTVVASSKANSRYTGTATTDAEGAFTLSEVPLGVVQFKLYDAEHRLLGEGEGELQHDGEVLSVVLQIEPGH